MSDVFEFNYAFHRNDVGRLKTVTVDIKRIHSVDIVPIGIKNNIIFSMKKTGRQVNRENAAPDTSPVKHWRITLFPLYRSRNIRNGETLSR
jgi:transposase